jgi:hypothetical protein
LELLEQLVLPAFQALLEYKEPQELVPLAQQAQLAFKGLPAL